MLQNYLPTKDNLSIFGGELFFQPDNALRPRSMGHIDAFSWTPSVEIEEVFAATSGIRTKIDEIITQIGVEISMTLKETSLQNMAYAMQGEIGEFTQPEIATQTITAATVSPGEMISLDAIFPYDVVVKAGDEVLVNGVQYVLNEEAGVVIPYVNFENITITYSAPSFEGLSARQAVNVLQNHNGISGVFHVIGKNKRGKRYAFRDFRATLRPSGDVALLSDGSALQQIELVGSGVENAAKPLAPWGTLIPLN